MNSIIEQYIAQNHFGKLLGMNFEILAPGNVHYFMVISTEHLATPLAAHGGSTAALLDATMGVGALSLVCDKNKVVATLEMKVSFLKSVLLNDKLTAMSIVVKQGRELIFMEAEMFNTKRQLVAKSSGTFIIINAEKSGYKIA